MIVPGVLPAADPQQEAAFASNPVRHDECGRRDRKKQATRQALRYAALQLVAERGFANVTVEDIAEAADVATRTFFNYFPSKETAVIGADPDRVEQMRLCLLARPAGEAPLTALRSVLVGYAEAIAEELDDLGEGKDAWFSRLSVVRNDPGLLGAFSAHMAEVERGLAGALAERLGADPGHDPYPALVTAAALAAARVAALYWSANGGADSLAALTGRALDSLAAGLADDRAMAGAPTGSPAPAPAAELLQTTAEPAQTGETTEGASGSAGSSAPPAELVKTTAELEQTEAEAEDTARSEGRQAI